jgi:hypothetical protein
MPTKTQTDSASVGQTLTSHDSHELETLWEDAAEDRLQHDLAPYERSTAHGKRIYETGELAPARDAPGEARRRIVVALRGHGCGEILVQDAALVVSELAANAVVHAKSSFSVSVSLRASTLRIDVADGGPVAAAATSQAWVPRQGRGLGLIDALCARWGTDATAEGKVVWGELQL